MFGRATITLGIGPHSSYFYILLLTITHLYGRSIFVFPYALIRPTTAICWFTSVCRAHDGDTQTDRQTDHATPSATNRPHLASAAKCLNDTYRPNKLTFFIM